jgi:hypothetical protein
LDTGGQQERYDCDLAGKHQRISVVILRLFAANFYGVSVFVKFPCRSDEHILEMMLVEINFGSDPSPLPLSIDLPVEHRYQTMPMPFGSDVLPSFVPSHVCGPGLVLADNLRVRSLPPFGQSQQVLRVDVLVTQEEGILHHLNETLCRHLVCCRVVHPAVVHLCYGLIMLSR